MSHNTNTTLTFEKGLPGFPECQNFILTDLKTGFYDPLKLLLSIDQPGLSFILYPQQSNKLLLTDSAQQEIKEHFSDKVDVYTMVTVKEPNGHFTLSTNLRAPVVIDRAQQKGWQYILSDKENQIEFFLEDLSVELRHKRVQAGVA